MSGWAAVGQIIDSGLNIYGKKRDMQEQRDFAQHGIRWKVRDAKLAGVHPMLALGANTTAYTPSPIMTSFGEAGQNVDTAIRRTSNSQERQMQSLQLDLLRSQIKETDARAAAFHSEAARNAQADRVSNPMPAPGALVPTGVVQPKPDPQVSAKKDDPTMTAGTHPAFREYVVGGSGLKIMLPYSEEGPAEAMESISWWQWPAIIQMNRQKYGQDWGTRAIQELMFGKNPRYAPNASRARRFERMYNNR